jgi:hypothetical protein
MKFTGKISGFCALGVTAAFCISLAACGSSAPASVPASATNPPATGAAQAQTAYAPPPAVIAAPGLWTSAQVSQFQAVEGSTGDSTRDACLAQATSSTVSFGDAMAAVSVAPASSNPTAAQLQAALIKKYGPEEGSTIYNEMAAVAATSSC